MGLLLDSLEQSNKKVPKGLPPSLEAYAKSQIDQGKTLEDVEKEVGGLQETLTEPVNLGVKALMLGTGGLPALGADVAGNVAGAFLEGHPIAQSAASWAPWGFVGKADILKKFLVSGALGTGGAGAEALSEGLKEEHPLTATGIDLTLPLIAGGLGAGFSSGLKKAREKGLQNIFTQEGRDTLYKQLRETLGEVPLLPEFIGKRLGGQTYNELFIPPSLRMPHVMGEGGAWFKHRASMRRVGEAAEKFGENVRKLDPEAREALQDVLAGREEKLGKYSSEAVERAFEATEHLTDVLNISRKGMTEAQRKIFDDRLNKNLQKMFDISDGGIWDTMKVVYQGHDFSSPNAIKNSLREVIQNPSLPKEVTQHAIDMYNLSERGHDIYRAANDAFKNLLYTKVLNSPWSSAEEKAGFTLLKDAPSPLKGVYIQKDVADGIQLLEDTPGIGRDLYNRYLLHPFKMAKVVMRVPALFRDMIGHNFILNDIAGQHPLSPFKPKGIKNYVDALKDLKQWQKTGKGEFQKFYELTGISPGTWSSFELSTVERGARYTDNLLKQGIDKMYDIFYKTAKPFAAVRKFMDSLGKYAKFRWNRVNGMSPHDAAVDAVHSTIDYMNATLATKRIRETALPFFTWQAGIARVYPEAIVKHPLRVAKYFALPAGITAYALNNLNITGDEWEQTKKALPEYLANGKLMLVPWRDEAGRLQVLDLSWMVPGMRDYVEWGLRLKPSEILEEGPRQFVQQWVQNPMFSLAQSVNNQSFSGGKIWNEWDDPKDKWLKWAMHIYKNMGPGWYPGGVDWNHIYNALEGPSELFGVDVSIPFETYKRNLQAQPSPEQALVSQMGVRVHPVDPERTMIQKLNIFDAWTKEAEHQMRRELENSSSDAQTEKIIQHYQKVFEDVQAKKENLLAP